MTDTSIEAYYSIANSLPASRAEVLGFLKSQNKAFTGHEIDVAMLCGEARNGDAHKRLSELENAGMVVRLGKRACTVTGQNAYEWAHVEAAAWKGVKAKAPTKKEMAARIKLLEETLETALFVMGEAVTGQHSPWCNGNHADNGACEGDYLVGNFVENAQKVLDGGECTPSFGGVESIVAPDVATI